MAIDMIENNELGALSTSRIGGFADDDRYANLLPAVVGAIGLKRRKKRTTQAVAQRTAEYSVDTNQSNDCNYLQQRLQEIRNKIEFELKKNPNKLARKRYLDPLYGAENNFKDAILRNKCEEKQSQAEEQKFKKETEEAIQRASESTPAIPNVKVAKGSMATKIILVAVGLLVVGVVGVALFRKK